MRYLIFFVSILLASSSICAESLENKARFFGDNKFEVSNKNAGSKQSAPGDLYLRTSDGKYIQINDKNYAVITDNVADATVFGRMSYEGKTYYIANSGKNAGYYLAYAVSGYIGTYRWDQANAWTQDTSSLCLTVDNGKSWKTYEYLTGGVKYVVIGDYSYTKQCFLPIPASDSYKTVSLQKQYMNENVACTWQAKSGQCPPYVTYYTDSQSATLALRVDQGKLYQGADLFDTSRADSSHSFAHTAIFVMDANGRIYASNQNKVYLFHHSSILGGRDVAFAGEMQVEKGVIKKVTNCSGHYRPDISLAQQLKDSLNKQGYAGTISVDECVAKLMDLDYHVLTPERKK